MELIAEDSPVSLKPRASLVLMEPSEAGVVVEVAGEAVVVETSEDKTMASEDVEVPEGGEEDLVAKVAPHLSSGRPNIIFLISRSLV